MTDTHSIAQPFEAEVSPANNRHVTVGYASRYPDYSRIPAITLKGQWLAAAGFATGTAIGIDSGAEKTNYGGSGRAALC